MNKRKQTMRIKRNIMNKKMKITIMKIMIMKITIMMIKIRKRKKLVHPTLKIDPITRIINKMKKKMIMII